MWHHGELRLPWVSDSLNRLEAAEGLAQPRGTVGAAGGRAVAVLLTLLCSVGRLPSDEMG